MQAKSESSCKPTSLLLKSTDFFSKKLRLRGRQDAVIASDGFSGDRVQLLDSMVWHKLLAMGQGRMQRA